MLFTARRGDLSSVRPRTVYKNRRRDQWEPSLLPPRRQGFGSGGHPWAFAVAAHPHSGIPLVHSLKLQTSQHGHLPWLAPICTSSLPTAWAQNLIAKLPKNQNISRDGQSEGLTEQPPRTPSSDAFTVIRNVTLRVAVCALAIWTFLNPYRICKVASPWAFLYIDVMCACHWATLIGSAPCYARHRLFEELVEVASV